MSDATRAEVCAAAIADAFADDGEIFASPMGLLPMLGVRLAKLTSNPDLVISDGESLFLAGVPPLFAKADVVEGWIPFRRVFDVVAYGKRHVMMGATQVDRHGNQNISAIGDFAQPKRQLLGSRGAPGNTVNNRTSYWVPKHSPRVFVEQVDIVSGVGPTRAKEAGPAAARFNDIHRIVTNLGVFDVGGPDDTVRLLLGAPRRHRRRGPRGHRLRARTSPATSRRPASPRMEELILIREVLDPQGPARSRRCPDAVIDAAAHAPRSPSSPASATRSCRPAWAGSSGPRLVTGTANAGGLGILASATMSLRRARARDPRGQGAAPTSRSASTCAPTPADAPDRCDLLIEHGVKVASFALAPKPELIAQLKDHGIVVMPVVGAAKHAEKVAGWGADAVMIQGGEGGGHTGPVPTTLLLPTVLDAVDIPVDRRRRLLRRPRPRGRAVVRRRRGRHGHPLPAHPRQRRARTRSSSSTSPTTSPAPSSPTRSTACRTGCCAPTLVEELQETSARHAGSARPPGGRWSSSRERHVVARAGPGRPRDAEGAGPRRWPR